MCCRIFDLLTARLSALYPIMTTVKLNLTSNDDIQADDPDGLQLCYYYLQMIYNVIQHANNNVWEALDIRSPFAGRHISLFAAFVVIDQTQHNTKRFQIIKIFFLKFHSDCYRIDAATQTWTQT